MILNETHELHNSAQIPKIALGIWQGSNEEAVTSVKTALALSCHHIDTAAYQNERGVAGP